MTTEDAIQTAFLPYLDIHVLGPPAQANAEMESDNKVKSVMMLDKVLGAH